MITAEDFRNFRQVAEELLTLFDEGCELRDVYPLLRRWQEILEPMPLDERKLQPWIICSIPEGASQSFYVQTFHPTREDDNWRMEWMPYGISAEDERELREHLQRMFKAWLRVVKRRDSNELLQPEPSAASQSATTREAQAHNRSNQRVNASGAVQGGKPLPTIEEIEQSTPKLDRESIEWVAARKENREKLGYSTTTLANYRQAVNGGRRLDAYFGMDKDGRRWRRCKDRTEKSTVFYFAPDLKKYHRKVSL